MTYSSKGYILPYLVLVFAVAAMLVLISADWRATRIRSSYEAYSEATALALAEGGIEAAAAAVKHGGLPDSHPLGDLVELTAARGTLTVESHRAGERVEVFSCAEVASLRRRVRPVRRCVEAVLVSDPTAQIIEWRER